MRRWMPRAAAAALATCAALSGCRGERPPLWTLYDDPAAQAPPVTGNAIIYDRTIQTYSWPTVTYWLGGSRGVYGPYPYPGRYGWYQNPAWGQPRPVWRNPAAAKAFGIRPAVPGPQTLPPSPSPPTLSRTPAPLLAPPVAPPVATPRVAPPVAAPIPPVGIPMPPTVPLGR